MQLAEGSEMAQYIITSSTKNKLPLQVLKLAVESNVKTTARKLKQENAAAFQSMSVRFTSRHLLDLAYCSLKSTEKPY